jgi:hypothetical protein
VRHLATGTIVSVTASTWDPRLPHAGRAAAATRHLLAPFL